MLYNINFLLLCKHPFVCCIIDNAQERWVATPHLKSPLAILEAATCSTQHTTRVNKTISMLRVACSVLR